MTNHQQATRKRWPWVVGGIALLIIIAVSCGSNTTTTPSGSSPAGLAGAPASPTPSFRETDSGRYGSPLKAGDVTVVAQAPKKSTQAYLGSQVCTTVNYTNGGTSPVAFNPFDWKFRTSDGVEASASIPFNAKSPLRSGNLAPGGKVSGQVCSDDTISQASAVVYSPGFGIVNELVWS